MISNPINQLILHRDDKVKLSFYLKNKKKEDEMLARIIQPLPRTTHCHVSPECLPPFWLTAKLNLHTGHQNPPTFHISLGGGWAKVQSRRQKVEGRQGHTLHNYHYVKSINQIKSLSKIKSNHSHTSMQVYYSVFYCVAGIEAPRAAARTGRPLVSARLISVNLFTEEENLSPIFTVMVQTFGQQLDHDIGRTAVTKLSKNMNGMCTASLYINITIVIRIDTLHTVHYVPTF